MEFADEAGEVGGGLAAGEVLIQLAELDAGGGGDAGADGAGGFATEAALEEQFFLLGKGENDAKALSCDELNAVLGQGRQENAGAADAEIAEGGFDLGGDGGLVAEDGLVADAPELDGDGVVIDDADAIAAAALEGCDFCWRGEQQGGDGIAVVKAQGGIDLKDGRGEAKLEGFHSKGDGGGLGGGHHGGDQFALGGDVFDPDALGVGSEKAGTVADHGAVAEEADGDGHSACGRIGKLILVLFLILGTHWDSCQGVLGSIRAGAAPEAEY